MLNFECCRCCAQESVINNGYAVIIQNTCMSQDSCGTGITRLMSGSTVSSFVMDNFFNDAGFKKIVLHTDLRAEVAIMFLPITRIQQTTL